MPYAKIDGKWKRVSTFTASQLGKAGYDISYIKDTAGTAFGSIGGTGFGLPPQGQTLEQPQQEIIADARQGLPDTYGLYVQPTENDNVRFTMRDLTPAEQEQFIAVAKDMRSNLGRWFVDDGSGTFVPNRSAEVTLEQMQGQGGGLYDMSDALMGAVSAWMNNGIPGNSYTTSNIPDLSGLGGGGSVGPQYVSPDRRTVEDTVKAQLFALTGETSPERVSELTDAWLQAHKQSWEVRKAGGQDIDPNATTLDMIRSQGDYKEAHKLRSEGEDEMTWISNRRQQLNRLGVSGEDADQRAITMAQLGTDVQDISTGAFQAGKGKQDIGMLRSMELAAQQIAGML